MKDDKRKAIEKTIAHWERMIAWVDTYRKHLLWVADDVLSNRIIVKNGLGETYDGQSCPLCQKYHCCDFCPLFQKFGRCSGNSANLYKSVAGAHNWLDWLEKARAFLDQIKSLLSEDEPEYKPLEAGDIITINDKQYILMDDSRERWALVNISTGKTWSGIVDFSNHDYGPIDWLLLEDFRKLLGSKADEWPEIYKTVKRRK